MIKYTLSGLLLLLWPFFLSAQLPSGFVAKYQLDNTANDVSGNGNNGSLTSTTSATNRFGTANAATQFASGSSFGSLPVVVMDNFSVGFWFNSTMTASSSTQWYGGNSLVDAEVCGQTNDWGTALINGGQVAFGVGNPDLTIISPLSYNDGAWHFITATRDESGSGTMILYVDGTQVVTTTGSNTGTLNAPGFLGLGENNCTGPDYTGMLDDLIFYPRVLSGAEVTTLFNTLSAVPLPLNWLAFTGSAAGNQIDLQWTVGDPVQNDHFEVERSTDDKTFSTLGSIPEKDGDAGTGGNLLYTYVDANPKEGLAYYRIKQVDIDGAFSWSKTITVAMQDMATGISLQFNPAHASLQVNNPSQQMIGEISIMDMTGRLLDRQVIHAGSELITLDISKLLPGCYVLRVYGSSNATTLPFIKQ